MRDLTVTGVQTCALPIWRHRFLQRLAACKIRRTPADQQQPPLRVWVRSAHRGIRIEWHAAGGKSVPHDRRVVERRAHGGARGDAELLYRALSRDRKSVV